MCKSYTHVEILNFIKMTFVKVNNFSLSVNRIFDKKNIVTFFFRDGKTLFLKKVTKHQVCIYITLYTPYTPLPITLYIYPHLFKKGEYIYLYKENGIGRIYIKINEKVTMVNSFLKSFNR